MSARHVKNVPGRKTDIQDCHGYSMLKNGSEYVDRGQEYYEEQYRDRVVENMKKRAEDMGYKLVKVEAASQS